MTKKARKSGQRQKTGKVLTFRKPFYYAAGDRVPYCPHCWETSNISVHLQGPSDTAGGVAYRCTNCRETYPIEARQRSPEPAEPRVEPYDLQREIMDRDREP